MKKFLDTFNNTVRSITIIVCIALVAFVGYKAYNYYDTFIGFPTEIVSTASDAVLKAKELAVSKSEGVKTYWEDSTSGWKIPWSE